MQKKSSTYPEIKRRLRGVRYPRAGMLPALAILAVLAIVSCDPGGDSESAHSRGGEIDVALKSYETMPEVRLGAVYIGEDPVEGARVKPAEQADADRVLELMRTLLAMLEARDIRDFERHVSQSRGLYVDLKAHRTYTQLQKDLQDPAGYLQTYYLNTEALRAKTGENEQLAVADVFRLTRVVTAEVYLQADRKECELRLRLEDAPSKSYYLNNPVFIKEDGEWFIYRLF